MLHTISIRRSMTLLQFVSFLLLMLPSRHHAFSTAPSMHHRGCRLTRSTKIHSSTRPPLSDVERDEIRHEIEEMKQEALRRMQALETKLQEAEVTAAEGKERQPQEQAAASRTVTESSEASPERQTQTSMEQLTATTTDERKETPVARPTQSLSRPTVDPYADRRLHRTWWKLMLNVGREPGTWMPKTWGISGDRLLMNLEVEFTSDQLFEREEFLNGMGGAKIMRVHDLYVGPTLTEDSHKLKVKETGGWRVASGEGPMGTDLLRFYIELEEEARHQGGDVYCPKGRVYMTCGIFYTSKDDMSTGLKDQLQKDQRTLSTRYEEVSLAMEEANLWDKIKLGKELMDLRMKLERVASEVNELKVREPEKSQLRFSPHGDVALTKEGGLCSKVDKGLAVEYHILGKFGVAAAPHHDDVATGKLKP